MANTNFTGTQVNDLVIGSNDNDVINGLGGDDQIFGAGGDDQLFGNAGNDVLIGGKGDDLMSGGDGNDYMVWNNGDGSDVMLGGAGQDVAVVNGGLDAGDEFELSAKGNRADFNRVNLGLFNLDIDDTETVVANGLSGDDSLSVADLAHTAVKNVVFIGGLGNDTLAAEASSQNVFAYGGAGTDMLAGGSSNDRIQGGDDNDQLFGNAGNDVLIGDKGDDLMSGGDGNDRMVWNDGDGSDVMLGGAGQDVAVVNGGLDAGDEFELSAKGNRADFNRVNLGLFNLDIDDTEIVKIDGLGGDDSVLIGALAATDVAQVFFDGGLGSDTVNASDSDVSIVAYGGDGDDILLGGGANDILSGGSGNNRLVGGLGADAFTVGFNGIDIIEDFDASQGDILRIEQDLLPGNALGSVDAIKGAVTYDSSSGSLSYDGAQIAALENPVSGFDVNSQLEVI